MFGILEAGLIKREHGESVTLCAHAFIIDFVVKLGTWFDLTLC